MWENEFDNIVCKRDKRKDININQLKLEVHDTFKKTWKKTKKFEPTDESNVINKDYLDEKFKKKDVHISYIEKDNKEFNLQYNKQSVEDISIQRAVKTTIQILYDKGSFDNYTKADKVVEDFSFVTRSRDDLSEQVIDDIQWFCYKMEKLSSFFFFCRSR